LKIAWEKGTGRKGVQQRTPVLGKVGGQTLYGRHASSNFRKEAREQTMKPMSERKGSK